MEEDIAPNYEIRRKNFQGTLPVQIRLDYSEIYIDKELPTYYIMQPRMSYFFLLIPQLIEFYSELLEGKGISNDEYWFSCRGEPLRFDLPIGVLYDTFIRENSSHDNLPFKICLHYHKFPTYSLQKGMSKYIFQQSLKESSMMRVGKATAVQDRLEHVRSMLNSIKEGKYDDFWRYNEEIGEHSLSQLKYFPVRIVINRHYHPYMLKEEKDSIKGNAFVIQRPVKVDATDI